MKLTLVIDTEDLDGIKDTWKIAGHFYRKYLPQSGYAHGHKVSFGKIACIKMLRKFARAAVEAHEAGIDPAGLRFCKEYAEELFSEQADGLS